MKIGLVGSGWMGKAHSSALADAEMLFGPDYGVASFEIVADSNLAAAEAAQKKIGFKKVSADWHDQEISSDFSRYSVFFSGFRSFYETGIYFCKRNYSHGKTKPFHT